jgi:hypothetical protein
MFKYIAHSASILFHPLFLISYATLFLMAANPYMFGFGSDKAQGLILISVVTTSLMFPLVAILLMKALGLIQSLQMEDKLERIGPLIVTGLFFIWLFVNIRKHDTIPQLLTFFVLGSTIGVFLALLFNSFTKISLHTIGAGGFLVGMSIIIIQATGPTVAFALPFSDQSLVLSQRLCLAIIVIGAGLVGTSRLYLKAHVEHEVYGGYIVGAFAQLVAYVVIF